MVTIDNMLILWFVIGALMGSVANALIYRLPREIPWVSGRSICPNCRHALGFWDLVPIFSYIVLGGRCRYCKEKIGGRYLVIEMVMSLFFAMIGYFSNFSVLGAIGSGIFWTLVIIVVMDWETKLISEGMLAILFLLILTNLILKFQIQSTNFQINSNFQIENIQTSLNMDVLSAFRTNLYGAMAAAGFIGLVWLVSAGRAMGAGDIELAGVLGFGLGWPMVGIGLWLAFVSGAIVGVVKMVGKKAKMKSEIAFGPFLIIGAVAAYFWGDYIMKLIWLK